MGKDIEAGSWDWLKMSPTGDVDGSTLGKMFRNSSLSPTAHLAREAVQNSNDAAERFKKDHPTERLKLRVVFRFVQLTGPEKAAAIEALGLKELNRRRAKLKKAPLGTDTAMDHLDKLDIPLSLLYIEDYCTHGLYGHPCNTSDSIMFRAMLEVGGSEKDIGAGGSYGFGKSALLGISKAKVIVAHTAFEPADEDPARSRLLGVTWWPSHKLDGENFAGRAIFASKPVKGKRINPYEDKAADQLANRLGFSARKPEDLRDLGTTFLIIDPLIEPSELTRELAIWWWPALEDHVFDIEVVMPDGEVTTPRPATLPVVKQFITPYRIATKEQVPQDPNREQLASNIWRNTNGAGGSDLGGLGLVVADEPVAMNGEPADATAVVALMRNPRMVIKYQEYKQRIPLRGVFVASDKSNDLLQQTEPSSHDLWSIDPSTDVEAFATLTAKSLLEKIRSSVSRMAKDITPPPPRTPRALSHFARLMTGFVGSKRGPGKSGPKAGEPIELQFPKGSSLEAVSEAEVKLQSAFSVRVSDDAPKDECDVTVECQLHVAEDENPNGSLLPVQVAPQGKDHGFTENSDGTWSGSISKAQRIIFSVVSDPYSNLWTTTVQPVVTVEAWSDQ